MQVRTLKSFAFQCVPELGGKGTNAFQTDERIDIPAGLAEKWARVGLVEPMVETATYPRPRKRRS
jgi:hypothetical protein